MNAHWLLDQWELVLLAATWSAIGLFAIKSRYDWRQRRFSQQVNFSLNALTGIQGSRRLLLRTLLEESAAQVWINDYGVRQVLKAARQTTVDQPFLRFADDRDRDMVRIAVLNVLSERFSDVFIARALGVPARTDVFLFALTWERYGEMKSQKLRVMVIKRADLQEMFENETRASELAVDEESHRPRIDTLRLMYALWKSPESNDHQLVGEVELGLPSESS